MGIPVKPVIVTVNVKSIQEITLMLCTATMRRLYINNSIKDYIRINLLKVKAKIIISK